MSHAGRVGDAAHGPSGDQQSAGGPGGIGASLHGSPDVLIDGRAALRVGDPGLDGGAGPWHARTGSRGVTINGLPAFRVGDEAQHPGGAGALVEGSPDVFFGDGRTPPRSRPHETVVALEVTDALGRPVHEVELTITCPHDGAHARTIDGEGSLDGLCEGATVTVHKALQVGVVDPGAGHGGPVHPKSHKGTIHPAAPPAVIHAPAPLSTPASGNVVHLAKTKGKAAVVLPTVHNWVELVYRALGAHLPTGPKQLALLGVREASLAPVAPEAPGPPVPVDTLEKQADAGDLDVVSFTREKVAPAYNDLLFCVWTDTTVHHRQHVEVFECAINAGPGKGPLHLPFLREGRMFHATPGPFNKHYPGSDVTLHVFEGKHERHAPKGTTAKHLLAVATKEKGTTEWPPGSNRQKYGAWYGANGVFWCAEFVSWCFAHAGMPQIHYVGCELGAGMFRNGSWGTWHGPKAHAEPGDIVFFNFPGEAVYDHTGIVIKDHGSTLSTVEGNTSPPGGSGSQSNGGGVYLKTRPKDGTIIGFGRPRFTRPEPPAPVSFVRWGGEGAHIHGKTGLGSTLLHHHYWRTDKHKKNHPDPDAARYRRFLQICHHAKNRAHIPYLIASSKYLKTYSEWATALAAHPGEPVGAKSVIQMSGLHSPTGHAHHYVPSFFSKAYADKVLAHARHMHDRHAAARIRAALLRSLITLSI